MILAGRVDLAPCAQHAGRVGVPSLPVCMARTAGAYPRCLKFAGRPCEKASSPTLNLDSVGKWRAPYGSSPRSPARNRASSGMPRNLRGQAAFPHWSHTSDPPGALRPSCGR